MNLIFLTAHNLRTPFFLKEFALNFKPERPTLILHDHFQKPQDTRFVTKRISALFSENLVVNHAFSGDQRRIFQRKKEEISVRKDLIHNLFQTGRLIILNPLVEAENETHSEDPFAILAALRQSFAPDQISVFIVNSLSPLAQDLPSIIHSEAEYLRLRSVYEEESEALEACWRLSPATLLSTRHLTL